MSKVKVKAIKKVIGDSNINGMFEEMMGMKDAETEIIIPKFVSVRNTLRYIYRILTQFSSFVGLREVFPEIESSLDEIKKFAEDMKESTYLKHDHDEQETTYNTVSKEDMNKLYKKLKENQYVRALVVLCNKLDKYHKNFTDTNNLKENFVNQEPGLSFVIFDFSSLDLKMLWANPKMKSTAKRYILAVFASLYKHTLCIYNTINSPDVDIDKFTDLLISSIAELKKQPKLNRCQAAFRRIEQSVELLKDKFQDYYRESIKTGNENALISSFIVDVSNQGGADARLTREFRTIIQYMHEVSQKTGKNKDPNVQKIMKMLNDNHSLMERHTGMSRKPVDDSEDKKDISDLDLDMKDTDSHLSPEEVAEEKRIKRLEKQKAKAKKKRVKGKSGRGKNNKIGEHRKTNEADDESKDTKMDEDIIVDADNAAEELDTDMPELMSEELEEPNVNDADMTDLRNHKLDVDEIDIDDTKLEDLIMQNLNM